MNSFDHNSSQQTSIAEEQYDVDDINDTWDEWPEAQDVLTDFSDTDMEQDMRDLYCEEDNEMVQAKVQIIQSLNRLFPTNIMISGLEDDENYTPSDDFNSDFSEDEDIQKEPIIFNEKVSDRKSIELTVGMMFRDNDIFRSALVEFSIKMGFDFDYINNRKDKVTAQCRNEICPWRIHASAHVDEKGRRWFQIKSMRPHKNCSRDFTNSRVTSSYLAKHYLEDFRDNPKWDMKAFQLKVRHDLEVEVSYRKCWRAKKKALTIIEGVLGQQYKLLKDYCEALRQSNPGSSVYLSTDAGHFQRIYICLDACKRGFLAGCRPIISLDACHLKGVHNGQIHAAVGRDGNDNMFPIAYAVCESESKETWLWFLQNLLSDIGNPRENGWCFISDQQKGLQEAIKELAPTAEHRFCVRHLYANFRKTFKEKQLKDAMWSCARATTLAQFQRAMDLLRGLDKDAYAYLLKLDPAFWSRHAFSYFPKSDALCSNISESFNSFIKSARDQPIIICLETIRKLLQKRFFDKRTGIEKYNGDICPRIWKKLEDNNKDSMHCNVYYGGGPAMEVEHTIYGTFVANVAGRSCTCRLWDLTGVPCSHACAAIRYIRGDPTDYVHQSYRKSEFLKTYEFYVSPVPGPDAWTSQGGEPILPPLFRRQAGRPRRRRIREVGEPVNPNRKRKGGITMTCSRCGKGGHNKRSCKGDMMDPKKVEQRKKDAERAARNRLKKKNMVDDRCTNNETSIEVADDSRIVKKAKVRRMKKVTEPIVIRESQISSNEQPLRNWHSEYDVAGNAIPIERQLFNGPSHVQVAGGYAMFTNSLERFTSNIEPQGSNVQRNAQSNVRN